MSNPAAFRRIFAYLMGFAGLTWVWSVALIFSWPDEKNPQWEPGLRLVAQCADGSACGIAYAELAEAAPAGRIKSLTPPEPAGDIAEADAWLSWKTVTGKPWQYQVSRSAWNFNTTVRYRLDGENPVLIALNRYDARILLYAMPLALFTLIGLFFRTLRHPS